MRFLPLLLALVLGQQPRSPEFGTLGGQLRDPYGAPLAGVRVAAAYLGTGGGADEASTVLANISQTDSEGRYRLEGVLPGRYLVVAGPLASPRYYPGVTELSQARIVTVIAGQSLSSLDFALPPAITVQGKIVNVPDEWSTLNRPLEIELAGVGLIIKTVSNSDLSFSFANVPPGTYRVAIRGLSADGPRTPAVTVGNVSVSGVAIDLRSNPFPDAQDEVGHRVFNHGDGVTVRGVVTQGITTVHAGSFYFRMDVKEETGRTTSWAILSASPRNRVEVHPGETVTVTGTRSIDGTHRVQLDAYRSAGTINGVPVAP